MSIGGAREKLLAQWRQNVGPACQAAIRDHYPFQAGATQDISLREFAQVFSAGGTLDSFFNDNLRPYVDTGVHPWRWRGGSSGDFGLGNAPLRQFERAAEIRDSYFVGTTANVGFTLTPTALDGTATVTLTTDGQSVSYDGRTPTQVRLQWPGLAGSTGAKVMFAAKANEEGSGPMVSGPWAWFHLLDQGHLRSSGAPGTFSLDFTNGGNRATFTVRAEGSADPFTGTLVREFRCPWSQP
jgi:type VI secretion system protein ImpL